MVAGYSDDTSGCVKEGGTLEALLILLHFVTLMVDVQGFRRAGAGKLGRI